MNCPHCGQPWITLGTARSPVAHTTVLYGEPIVARTCPSCAALRAALKLEQATFQKFRDEAYAREAQAGLIRTQIEAKLKKAEEELKKVVAECDRLRDQIPPLIHERGDAQEQRDATEARVETLEKAVEIMRSSAYCEHLHHEKRDRHTFGDTCPVEARLAAALKEKP